METINKNYTRVLTCYRTPEATNALKANLNNQTWSELYAAEDINESYETFVCNPEIVWWTLSIDKAFPQK